MKSSFLFRAAALTALLLGCSLATVSVAGPGWADSLESLQRHAAAVKTVRADFVQEKRLPILVTPLISKGRFRFRTPEDLRWEYTEPVRSVLLMHHGEAKRFIGTSEGLVADQSIRLEAMRAVVGEMTGWLSGRITGNPRFAPSFRDGRAVLTPQDPGIAALIREVRLIPSETPGLIAAVEIVEQDGETAAPPDSTQPDSGPTAESLTRISFIGAEANAVIPDTEFTEP